MKKLLIIAGLLLNIAFSQINVDKTRIILDHSQTNTEIIMLTNASKTAPFLAQSWIEDVDGTKIEGPLMALPVIMRINPSQSKQVRISLVGGTAQLPTDRESLFFFNVMGIPPANNTSGRNSIELAIKTKLKVFYRPKGLPKYTSLEVIQQVRVEKHRGGFSLQNPSPYNVVVYGVSDNKEARISDGSITVKPFSTADIPTRVKGNTPRIHYVDEYGGVESVSYSCRSNQCTMVQ